MKLDAKKLRDEVEGHEQRLAGPLWAPDAPIPSGLVAPWTRFGAVATAVDNLRALLSANPPSGVTAAYVGSFFDRYANHLANMIDEYLNEEQLREAGLKAVPGLTVPEQIRLLEIVTLSLAHKAEPEPNPDIRRARAAERLASIQRALLSQKTTAQTHEPGQTGYSEVRSSSGRLPIRRWFRENAERLTQIADEAQASKYEPTARQQIKLLRNMPPSILGHAMLPKDSVWDIVSENRTGTFFYGWDIRPPGQGYHIIPKADATIVQGPDWNVKSASHPSYGSWRIFTDDAGKPWAVRGSEAITAGDLDLLRAAASAKDSADPKPFEQTLDEFRASPAALLVPADSVLGIDPDRETAASLSRFSKRNLQVAARVTSVAHTGTKSEIARRLVQVWLIRKEISLDTVDSLRQRPGSQLRRYLEALHLFKGGNKYTQAVTLINWRDQARSAGKALVAKGKWLAAIVAAVARGKAIPDKVRSDLEVRGEAWVLEPAEDGLEGG